jgi:sugar/nucleoside kinase (ribokinase family)
MREIVRHVDVVVANEEDCQRALGSRARKMSSRAG